MNKPARYRRFAHTPDLRESNERMSRRAAQLAECAASTGRSPAVHGPIRPITRSAWRAAEGRLPRDEDLLGALLNANCRALLLDAANSEGTRRFAAAMHLPHSQIGMLDVAPKPLCVEKTRR